MRHVGGRLFFPLKNALELVQRLGQPPGDGLELDRQAVLVDRQVKVLFRNLADRFGQAIERGQSQADQEKSPQNQSGKGAQADPQKPRPQLEAGLDQVAVQLVQVADELGVKRSDGFVAAGGIDAVLQIDCRFAAQVGPVFVGLRQRGAGEVGAFAIEFRLHDNTAAADADIDFPGDAADRVSRGHLDLIWHHLAVVGLGARILVESPDKTSQGSGLFQRDGLVFAGQVGLEVLSRLDDGQRRIFVGMRGLNENVGAGLGASGQRKADSWTLTSSARRLIRRHCEEDLPGHRADGQHFGAVVIQDRFLRQIPRLGHQFVVEIIQEPLAVFLELLFPELYRAAFFGSESLLGALVAKGRHAAQRSGPQQQEVKNQRQADRAHETHASAERDRSTEVDG